MSDELGMIYVTSKYGLGVRDNPNINSQALETLSYQEEKKFFHYAKDDDGNLWVNLSLLGVAWVCVEYRGQELAMVSIAHVTEQKLPQSVNIEARVAALEEQVKRLMQIAGLS